MDERIDILTPEGKPTGKTALKSEAHKNGWFHATVHIWLFTSDEKILLQKRALTKKVFPGLWDISVAGHIGAGESILSSAKRDVFIAELKVPISDLIIQKEEVDAIKLFDLSILKDTKNIENVLLSRFHSYYCDVYSKIHQHVKKNK